MNKIAASICILGACVCLSGTADHFGKTETLRGAAIVAAVAALVMGLSGQDAKPLK